MISAPVDIPAHVAATRLSGKPLADICGTPMIVRVPGQARTADIGPVSGARDDKDGADTVPDNDSTAILKHPDHASGASRVTEAAGQGDPGERHDVIPNVPGDTPLIAHEAIRTAIAPLAIPEVSIG